MANWICEFENQVHYRGREPALIAGNRVVSYDELNREACAFANWARENGHERIAIFVPNCYEFYVVEFGALKSGAIAIPINYMFASEIITFVLADSECTALVVRASDSEAAAKAIAGTNVRTLVTIGESSEGSVTLESIVATFPQTFESVPKDDAELFGITYTSGTTGRPKGVMKSHRNIGVHVSNMVHVWKLTPASRWVCAGPVYHTSGLESSSLPLLAAGGTVISLRWNIDAFFDAVQRYKADAAYIAGSMLIDISSYKDPERWDLSSLKYVVGGGTKMNENAYARILERYSFILTERMGMTEAGIIFVYPVGRPGAYTPREELPYRIPGSCGKPLYNQTHFRLIDQVTGDIRTTGEGELQLRGDSLFMGYLNMPERTKSAFTDDGWYRTGDLIRIADDGHVFHLQRRDEIIISGGENISPAAIESVAEAHPDVLEAAAFALPHERWGQEVCVALVVRADSTLTEETFIAYCKDSGRLAKFEVPKRVVFRADLPKTPTLSVPRNTLTAEYLHLVAPAPLST